MDHTWIRITKLEQEAEGVDELIRHTRVIMYRGGILCVPKDALSHLDRLGIAHIDVPDDGSTLPKPSPESG
jgi:hypothetical protein